MKVSLSMLVCLLFSGLAGWVAGAVQNAPVDTEGEVKARKFIVVDDEGRDVAVFGQSGGEGFMMMFKPGDFTPTVLVAGGRLPQLQLVGEGPLTETGKASSLHMGISETHGPRMTLRGHYEVGKYVTEVRTVRNGKPAITVEVDDKKLVVLPNE